MWTLISSINFRVTRRRVARPVVTATVVLGTLTQIALALLPQPATAAPDACDSALPQAWHADTGEQFTVPSPDIA